MANGKAEKKEVWRESKATIGTQMRPMPPSDGVWMVVHAHRELHRLPREAHQQDRGKCTERVRVAHPGRLTHWFVCLF